MGGVRGTRLRMVADTDPRRAAGDFSGSWSNMDGGASSIDFSKVTGTSDPMELIHSDEIDLVDICVPTPFHLDLALAAIKAGKHVLCEKPLARTAADARRIARAAEKGAGFFMPAMCLRFWPEWAWLKKAVEKGTYGKVISAEFRRVGAVPPGWFVRGDLSGGAILDLHLHDTDFVHSCVRHAGCGQQRRLGRAERLRRSRPHALHLRRRPGGHRRGQLGGPGDALRHELLGHLREGRRRLPPRPAGGSADALPQREGQAEGPEADRRQVPGGDGYKAEMAYLAKCIRSGTTPDVVTAAEAAESIRIVEAENKSALSGRTVRL